MIKLFKLLKKQTQEFWFHKEEPENSPDHEIIGGYFITDQELEEKLRDAFEIGRMHVVNTVSPVEFDYETFKDYLASLKENE